MGNALNSKQSFEMITYLEFGLGFCYDLGKRLIIMDDVRSRVERAADSILGDERLTAGLDDQTADFLLDWGLALATTAVIDTGSLDDEGATETMQPRIKATKRLLRYVNYWLQNYELRDPAEIEDTLSEIFKMAKLAYGHDLDHGSIMPEEDREDPELAAFLSRSVGLEGTSIEMVYALRRLLEGDGQEITNG